MEVEVPWFPCWGINLEKRMNSTQETIKKFLEIRPNNRWLLISKYSAASERHLWSAWYIMEENYVNNSALSNNPDAEFIRIISGTNQLKTAFSRAGLNENDEEAWLLYLPKSKSNLNNIPEIDNIKITEIAQKIIYQLNTSVITQRPKPNLIGVQRLGIEKNDDKALSESIFISHMAKSSFSF